VVQEHGIDQNKQSHQIFLEFTARYKSDIDYRKNPAHDEYQQGSYKTSVRRQDPVPDRPCVQVLLAQAQARARALVESCRRLKSPRLTDVDKPYLLGQFSECYSRDVTLMNYIVLNEERDKK